MADQLLTGGCCITLAGVTLDCEATLGGISEVRLACRQDITITVEDNIVTAIEAAAGTFHTYQFRKQTGSMTVTDTVDTAVGSVYFETALALQFSRLSTAKSVEMSALAISELVALVRDNNGTWWFLGDEHSLTLTEGTGQTGTAFADLNGYNKTLTTQGTHYPYEVAANAIPAA